MVSIAIFVQMSVEARTNSERNAQAAIQWGEESDRACLLYEFGLLWVAALRSSLGALLFLSKEPPAAFLCLLIAGIDGGGVFLCVGLRCRWLLGQCRSDGLGFDRPCARRLIEIDGAGRCAWHCARERARRGGAPADAPAVRTSLAFGENEVGTGVGHADGAACGPGSEDRGARRLCCRRDAVGGDGAADKRRTGRGHD